MRQITQIAVHGHDLFAVCADGTLWRMAGEFDEEGDSGYGETWEHVAGPGEGIPGRREPTIDEMVERLRQTGRKFIINGQVVE